MKARKVYIIVLREYTNYKCTFVMNYRIYSTLKKATDYLDLLCRIYPGCIMTRYNDPSLNYIHKPKDSQADFETYHIETALMY